jgi:hypothetical chaperone protein
MDQLLCLVEEPWRFGCSRPLSRAARAVAEQQTTFRFDYPSIHIREDISRPQFEAASERPMEAISVLDATVAGVPLVQRY